MEMWAWNVRAKCGRNIENFEKSINFAVCYDYWLHSDMIATINSLSTYTILEGNL